MSLHEEVPQSVEQNSAQLELEILIKAFNNERGEDQFIIAKEVVKCGVLLLRKNRDYGSSVWQNPILAPECTPGTAIRVRMSDKIHRILNLLKRPNEVAAESIDDAFRDLAGYCLLELVRPNR